MKTYTIEFVKLTAGEAVCEKRCVFNISGDMIIKQWNKDTDGCIKPKRFNCYHALYIFANKYKPGKRTVLADYENEKEYKIMHPRKKKPIKS